MLSRSAVRSASAPWARGVARTLPVAARRTVTTDAASAHADKDSVPSVCLVFLFLLSGLHFGFEAVDGKFGLVCVVGWVWTGVVVVVVVVVAAEVF